ncbi:trypsin-like serine peptidase [Mameliella sediminis]|uniref:trypsin-like serine peptidase n=1 Tax=Mameliella sediminis TaxID=2836866 RepID=UPI001C46A685|nr:serine protease [Mameliella sediminis]MBV7392734.1 serine protease [Mameliella sediminis]
MTRFLSFALVLAFAQTLAGNGAQAQVATFSADDYGKTDLVFLESTGNASAYIAAQDGAFEPIRELPADDPIRRLASAIGRVDLLEQNDHGGRDLITCTGAILPGGWVLTNHHCIPEDGRNTLLAASILTGYLVQGDKGTHRYSLSVDPSDWHSVLDFSLVRMTETPQDILPLLIQNTEVDPGDPLTVIHHPLGRPQVMTRFRCFATREQDAGPILRHRCDTQPGSSGSILFDREMRPVALHHSGGMTPNDDRSFNKSTRLSAILGQSELLRQITGGGAPAASAPAAPAASTALPVERAPATGGDGLGSGGINDLLRGN